MAVSSNLQRDTLVVLRLKLSRNKFVSGYPVTEQQIASCSADEHHKSLCLRGFIADNRTMALIFRMSFH